MHVKEGRALISLLLFTVLVSRNVLGQNPTGHPFSTSVPSQPRTRVGGYLEGREPGFINLLPPYPALNSIEDENDVSALRRWQQSDGSARWKLANADVEMSYDRFASAFGAEISEKETPLLVNLLTRVERDVQSVAFSAKDFYNRPRPFQRFQMKHVCGAAKAPLPEVPPKGGSSYPSGHTSFGWGAVLILAEVAPERAQELLSRGREYGESRIVCAVHYPSDVVGGQIIATAVVGRLQANPAFKEDLVCAQQEHAVALKLAAEVSPSCQARLSK